MARGCHLPRWLLCVTPAPSVTSPGQSSLQRGPSPCFPQKQFSSHKEGGGFSPDQQ